MEETREEMLERVKQCLLDERGFIVGKIPVYYLVHNATETPDVLVDSNGIIYVHGRIKCDFANLIAFHETLEYDWLIEQGLPAPRYNTETDSKEAEMAMEIHLQVHYLELRAAKRMGVLDEYVKWRPHEFDPNSKNEDGTYEYYKKLKSFS